MVMIIRAYSSVRSNTSLEHSSRSVVRSLLHVRLNPQCTAVAHTQRSRDVYNRASIKPPHYSVLLLQTKGLTGMAVPKMAVYIQDG